MIANDYIVKLIALDHGWNDSFYGLKATDLKWWTWFLSKPIFTRGCSFENDFKFITENGTTIKFSIRHYWMKVLWSYYNDYYVKLIILDIFDRIPATMIECCLGNILCLSLMIFYLLLYMCSFLSLLIKDAFIIESYFLWNWGSQIYKTLIICVW